MSALINTVVKENDGKGGLTFVSTQDCDPIAEMCQRLQREGKTGTSEMRLVGTIPDVIVEKYCIEQGVSYHEFCIDRIHIKRIVNDPDYAKFRIWSGQI